MKNTKIRLFVADVDNTLRGIREELFVEGQNMHTISPSLTRTFIELHERGVLLAIASGRPLWQELSHHHIDWNLPFQFDAIIGLNGGEVYDNADGTTKHFHQLTTDQIKRIITGMEPLSDAPMIYCDGYELVHNPDEIMVSRAAKHHTKLVEAEQLSDLWQKPTAKVLYRQSDPARMKAMEAYAKEHIDDYTISSFMTTPENLEFQSPLVNKGTGLKAYCEAHQISLDQVIAFGDSENDMTMLREAGWSVAMANAMDSVKKATDDVTRFDVYHNGVGDYLDTHLLPLLEQNH
jgi:Cof subfamily protein (haloacid dehalogenase superfamily)